MLHSAAWDELAHHAASSSWLRQSPRLRCILRTPTTSARRSLQCCFQPVAESISQGACVPACEPMNAKINLCMCASCCGASCVQVRSGAESQLASCVRRKYSAAWSWANRNRIFQCSSSVGTWIVCVNRKLYVVDAQPRANALANGAKGGGSESSSNYPKSEVLFLGIQNIHTMRDSLSRLRDYVDAHGSISSNGSSLVVPLVGDWRNRGPNRGGGSLNSMTQFSSMLVEWLNHIQNILIGASGIAAQIAQEYIITKTSKNGLMLPLNLIGIYWWRCGTQENIIDWILWASCQKSSRVKLFVLLFCLFFLERLIFYAHLCKKLPLEVSDRRLCRKL